MNAPTIVFAYNRPKHLQQTLSALAQNEGAAQTELFVFIDGPKTEREKSVQCEVEQTARRFEASFQRLSITVSPRNKGLARSIIGGVTDIIGRYERVIVAEDDAVAAPGFLRFMNEALDYYQNDASVWSIGGYTVPVALPADYRFDVIKTQRSSSYAWATWKTRWDKIDWDVSDYRAFRRSITMRRGFNHWGNDRAGMLDSQMVGAVNSWAIRFDYAMFKHHMYNIVPVQSLIKNIGHDGSGTHSTVAAKNDVFAVDTGDAPKAFRLADVDADERIRRSFCKPFYLPPFFRVKQYIKHCVFRSR